MKINQLNKILKNKTVRNGGLFSIYSFFNRGIGFLLLVLLAEYITPEQYGELSLFNTVVMFLGYVAGLSTSGYLSVSYFKKTKDQFIKDFSAICIITCIVSGIIALIFVILHEQLSIWLKVPTPFLFVGITIAFANIFVQLNLDYLRVQEKVSKYGILSCSFAVLNLTLSLFLVVVVDLNWQGRVFAQLSCDIIFGIIALSWFIKDRLLHLTKDWKRYKNIILWGLPIIPHHATIWIKQGLDRYIIDGTHTMADVGLFSFALNIASIMTMIGMAFNATNSVNLYQTLSSNKTDEEKRVSLKKKERYFSLLYIACAILVAFLGTVLIPLFLPKYSDALPYFLILNIFGLLRCIYFLYCNYLFYYGQNKKLMNITFGTSIFHLCLSLILTRYSLFFTCCLYVVTEALVCTLVYIWSQKSIKRNLAVHEKI